MRWVLLLAMALLAAALAGCGGSEGGGSPSAVADKIESCLDEAGLNADVAAKSSIEASDLQAGVRAEVRSVASGGGLAEVTRIFDDDAAAQKWVEAKEKADAASSGPDIVAYEKVGRTALEVEKQGDASDKLRACAQENG